MKLPSKKNYKTPQVELLNLLTAQNVLKRFSIASISNLPLEEIEDEGEL